MISLFLVKETINLHQLKHQLGVILAKEQTPRDSHYRRLTRFFNAPFHLRSLWKAILQIVIEALIAQLDKQGGNKYLVMDASCWEFGSVKFHFLFLSIVYEGESIPIYVLNLSKKGLSHTEERKRFLQMANLLFPLKGLTLIAAREYIGRDWFVFLVERLSLNFVIRLPQRAYKEELGYLYGPFIRHLRKGKTKEVAIQIGTKNKNPEHKEDDLVILLTNLPKKKNKILSIYAIGWQIECMFKSMKSNGFRIEDLGLTNPLKVRLMMVLVIAT